MYALKIADCLNQNLKSIPRNIDDDVKTLNFHGNQLTYLGIDSFSTYRALQNIYLARNRLEVTNTFFAFLFI